jgi:iron complex outermembrane recepter protein
VISTAAPAGVRGRSLRRAAALFGATALSTLVGVGAAGAADAPAAADTGSAAAADAAAPALATEVVVTARRRKEALQGVPLAISAVSGPELNHQHLDRVADFAAKIPNFAALQQNPRVSQVAIRGLGGNANNDGAESGVGLIVDNVFMTHVGFSWNDFPDLDGIEVVRGPQGTLLGKNTTIGAVIIKTKLPSFERALDVDATYGNDDRKQFHINATGPIVTDKLAYRLTVGFDQGGGWVKNAGDGNKYLDTNRQTVRGQLLFTPTDNFSDRLIVEHDHSREYNNFYVIEGDTSSATNWTAKLKTIFGYSPAVKDYTHADYDTQDRIVSKVDGASNEANWTVDKLTLTSITAWRRFTFQPYNDGDYSPFPISRSGYAVDVSQYSEEVRLANQTGGPVDWQVGAYGLREDLSSDFEFNFLSDAAAYFLGSAAVPSAILDGVNYSKWGRTYTKSGAVFGQATWRVTDKADITGGLRYTHEDRTVSVIGSVSGGATLTSPTYAYYRRLVLASVGGAYTATGGVFDIGATRHTDSVSWLINPSYKLTKDILLYASASYGEKSGAANTTASPVTTTATLPLIIQPEKSLDFEAGVKSTWLDRRLVVNLNLFDDTITNYQASQYTTGLVSPYLGNVGKVRLEGVELESRFAVTPELNLDVSAGYDDARYVSYADAPTPTELVSTYGSTLSLTGYQLVGAPKVTAEVSVDYRHDIGNGLELFTYGNAQYRSRVSLYNPRSQFGWQGDYTLFNAGVGVRSARYSLLVWSKNLGDKRYLTGFGSATGANPFLGVVGDHRTFGVTVTGKF